MRFILAFLCYSEKKIEVTSKSGSFGKKETGGKLYTEYYVHTKKNAIVHLKELKVLIASTYKRSTLIAYNI